MIARRERPHPGAQLTFTDADGWRVQTFITDQPDADVVDLERRHRAHARVEDRIRDAKDTGLGNLPFADWQRNEVWLELVLIGQALLAWLQRLTLHGDLAKASPKTIRYRLLHVAARLVRRARGLQIRLQRTWPWTRQLDAAFTRLRALPAGLGFADALAGAPAAGRQAAPVLLSRPDCVPGSVASELERLDPDRVVLLGGTAALGPAVARLAGCGVSVSVLARGLNQPWDVVHTPDGRAWISERSSARLLVREPGGALREVQRLPADPEGEGGLLGLAVSPDYERDGLLYAYLTSASDNRVVRFRPGGAVQAVVTGIPKARIHNGGRIAFGPDGMLYIGTGDAGRSELAQDRSALAGKILRVTRDGGVPADNPFGNAVWSYGHRNVQGLAFDASGALYATEFGPNRDDEINRIRRGGNYGWPLRTGRAGDPRFVDPILVRQPSEASWSGATFLRGGAIGAWEGDLFAAALRGQRLWRIRIRAGAVASAEALLTGQHGRLRQVRQAPDGSLWVLSGNGSDDRLLRIGPPS